MSSGANLPIEATSICHAWATYSGGGTSIADLARASGVREGSILEYTRSGIGTLTIIGVNGSNAVEETTFSVVATFDQTFSIQTA